MEKARALLDVETQVPSFLLITEAKVKDVNAMDYIPYEVIDKKDGLADNILKDCRIKLTGYKTRILYGKLLRMVDYYDVENMQIFTYLTNSNKISASRVAELYRNRWLQILGISLTGKTPLCEVLAASKTDKLKNKDEITLDLFDSLFLS